MSDIIRIEQQAVIIYARAIVDQAKQIDALRAELGQMRTDANNADIGRQLATADADAMRAELASLKARMENVEATHRLTLHDMQKENMRLATELEAADKRVTAYEKSLSDALEIGVLDKVMIALGEQGTYATWSRGWEACAQYVAAAMKEQK